MRQKQQQLLSQHVQTTPLRVWSVGRMHVRTWVWSETGDMSAVSYRLRRTVRLSGDERRQCALCSHLWLLLRLRLWRRSEYCSNTSCSETKWRAVFIAFPFLLFLYLLVKYIFVLQVSLCCLRQFRLVSLATCFRWTNESWHCLSWYLQVGGYDSRRWVLWTSLEMAVILEVQCCQIEQKYRKTRKIKAIIPFTSTKNLISCKICGRYLAKLKSFPYLDQFQDDSSKAE